MAEETTVSALPNEGESSIEVLGDIGGDSVEWALVNGLVGSRRSGETDA